MLKTGNPTHCTLTRRIFLSSKKPERIQYTMFGIISPGKDCMETLFYGTDYHSTWGTAFGGMAVRNDIELNVVSEPIKDSQFKTALGRHRQSLSGHMGIGVISPKEEQPLTIIARNSNLGTFAICTVGFIENAEELVQKIRDLGINFELDQDPEGNFFINNTKLAGALIG